jgi:hypothetical protein
MGGGEPSEKEQAPAIEYTAQAASPLVSGEVKMTIGENSLTVTALFDAVEIAYAEMNALIFADYAVTVKADGGDYAFSRMGEWAQRFYDALCDAYNKAVLRSLFVEGEPLVTAKGEYRYIEGNATGGGSAPIHVYENSVVSLPPDLGARRVPLCFVTAMEKGDYALTLTLGTGESYTYAKLGYDTAPVETAIEKQIRALREKTLAAVKEIDPTLTAAQASQVAKLVPQGAAAPIGQLAGIAPSFVAALEAKIAATRAAESYKAFKELCDPAQIWVGFRKNEADKDAGGGMADMLGGLTGGGSGGIADMLGGLTGGGNPLAALGGALGGVAPAEGETETAAPDPYLLWLIAPSPDGQYAAVEFAEADSATFVYRTGGDFTAFARQINRALEAIDFKREVIRLTDVELRKPDNANYYMAAKRTAALGFVRANFTGRVIHSSPEAWKRKLTELWSGKTAASPQMKQNAPTEAATPKFCGQCGAQLTPGIKFCGGCGAKS